MKELNTVIVRAVDEKGTITKVPFNFRQVPGSLTGEVLAEEIMDNISNVKATKNKAAATVTDALVSSSSHNDTSEKQLDELHAQLKEAANALDFDNMNTLQTAIQLLQDEIANSYNSTITENTIIPTPPNYFNIATLKGINHDNKVIHLEIPSQNIPTSICGDSCSTNKKANRLVTEWYGVMSPEADCSSHAASGTIRRTCTSVTMSDPDASTLYNALRKVLKHFSLSAKSTELLNRALDALEQNNVHMLVWGGTRMAGFLDGCKQSSSILVPFLDTLIVGQIRDEETAIILKPKGLFTLELFADLHPVFSNQYLHVVDSDKILSCEVYAVAHKTAERLLDPLLPTPKADNIYNNLSVDGNDNVLVTLVNPSASSDDDNDTPTHSHILNEKLTRHRTFEDVKKEILETKSNILKRLHDNIVDQVDEDLIFFLFNVFDLNSREGLDEKIEEIRKLHQIYGKNKTHIVNEQWFGFNVHINYTARLNCSEEELVSQFNSGYEKLSSLAREHPTDQEAARNGGISVKLTQHDQYQKFIKVMDMQCPQLCDLIVIMISVPPNSGWVERAYSYLEQICMKKRNRMNIEKPLKELFFLALLKLTPKKSTEYSKEIQILSGEQPLIN